MESLIIEILKELIEISNSNKTNFEKGKLQFPRKRDGSIRISEQELRVLLVRKFEKFSQLTYSVEAPSMRAYSFTGKNKRSGNIDLCLYKDKVRKHLIELKSHNPRQEDYSKDFEKLLLESQDENKKEIKFHNFFIQIIESSDSGTFENIENKYKEAIKHAKSVAEKEQIKQINNNITIYLCDLGIRKKERSIRKYEIGKDLELSSPKTIYVERS